MSAETKFTKYDDWKAAGDSAGFDGPYTIAGTLHLHQFVAPGKGTQGMWNAFSNSGYLFVPSPSSDAGESK